MSEGIFIGDILAGVGFAVNTTSLQASLAEAERVAARYPVRVQIGLNPSQIAAAVGNIKPITVQINLQGAQVAQAQIARVTAEMLLLNTEVRTLGVISQPAFRGISTAIGGTTTNVGLLNAELNTAINAITRMTTAWQVNGQAARASQTLALPANNAAALIGRAGGFSGAGMGGAALGLSFISPTAGLAAMALQLGPVVAGLVAAGLAAKTLGDGIEKASIFQRSLQQIKGISGESVEEMNQFGKYVQKLSTDLPLTTQQLTELGRQAVLVGLHGSEGIHTYTENMAALSIVLRDVNGNSQGVEAVGQEVVKVMRSMGASVEEVNKQFAGNVNSLVALKSQFGVQVPLVTGLAKFWSSYGAEIGLTTDQVYGWSAALVSVGARAQGAGSSLQRFFQVVTKDASEGASGMGAFGKIMHMTGDEALNLIKTDPSSFLKKFIDSLPNFQRDGKDSAGVLASIGLTSQQVIRAFTELATSSGNVDRALAVAKGGMNDTGLAMRTAQTAADNFKDKTIQLGNSWDAFKTNIGAAVIPALTNLLQSVTPVAQEIFKLSQDLQGLKSPDEIKIKLTVLPTDSATTAFMKMLVNGFEKTQHDPLTEIITGKMSTDILKLGLVGAERYGKAQDIQGQLQRAGVMPQAASLGEANAQVIEILKDMAKYQKMAAEAQAQTVINGKTLLGISPAGSVPNIGPLLPGQTRPGVPAPTTGDIVKLIGVAGRTILNEFNVSGANYHHDGFANPNAVHHGVDYAAPRGTPIYAPFAGSISTRSDAKNGNVFELADLAGNKLVGLHLNQFNEQIQAAILAGGGKALIAKGTQIGTVGNTGAYAGGTPHLHLEGWLPDGTKADFRKIGYAGMPAAMKGGTGAGDADTGPSITELANRLDVVQGRMTVAGKAAGKYAGSLREIQAAALVAAHGQQEGSKDWDKAVQVYGSATSALKGLEKGTKEYVASRADFNKYGQAALDLIKSQEKAQKSGSATEIEAARGAIVAFQARGEAAKAVFGAESEAHSKTLSNQAEAAAETKRVNQALNQGRITDAQAALERLRTIQQQELDSAGDNQAKRLGIVRQTSQQIYNAEMGLARVTQRNAIAGAQDEKNPEARAALISAANKAYGLADQKAQLDRIQAVHTAQKSADSQAQQQAKEQRDVLARLTDELRQGNVQKAEDELTKLGQLRERDLAGARDNAAQKLAITKRYGDLEYNAAVQVAAAIRDKALKDSANSHTLGTKADDAAQAAQDGAARRAYDLSVGTAGATRSQAVTQATDAQTSAVQKQRAAYHALADSIRQQVTAGTFNEQAQHAALVSFNALGRETEKLGLTNDSYVKGARAATFAIVNTGAAANTIQHQLADSSDAMEVFADSVLRTTKGLEDLNDPQRALAAAQAGLASVMVEAGKGAVVGNAVSVLTAEIDRLKVLVTDEKFQAGMAMVFDAPTLGRGQLDPTDIVGIFNRAQGHGMPTAVGTVDALPTRPKPKLNYDKTPYVDPGVDARTGDPTARNAAYAAQLATEGQDAYKKSLEGLSVAELQNAEAVARRLKDTVRLPLILAQLDTAQKAVIQSAHALTAIQAQQDTDALESAHALGKLTDSQYEEQKQLLLRTQAWQKWKDVYAANGDLKAANAQLWADLAKIDQDGTLARRTIRLDDDAKRIELEKQTAAWVITNRDAELSSARTHLDNLHSATLVSDRDFQAQREQQERDSAKASYDAGRTNWFDYQEELTRITAQGVMDRAALDKAEIDAFVAGLQELGSTFEQLDGVAGLFGKTLSSIGTGIQLFQKGSDLVTKTQKAFGSGGSFLDKLGAVGGWLGVASEAINLIGGIGDAILNLSPGFQAWKKNLTEVANLEKAAAGASVGLFKNPFAEALNEDAANRDKLVGANFWQRATWAIFGGAPTVLSDEAAKLKVTAADIFADLGQGISSSLTDGLMNAFSTADWSGSEEMFQKSLNKTLAGMYIAATVKASGLEAAIQAYATAKANGGDGVAELANVRDLAMGVFSSAQTGISALTGYGADATSGITSKGLGTYLSDSQSSVQFGLPSMELKVPDSMLKSFDTLESGAAQLYTGATELRSAVAEWRAYMGGGGSSGPPARSGGSALAGM